ncbi:MAG: adenosylmethionine--8-amino-7-oxononanoate transaminase [Thermoguttaceae bacterium]|jgi:adenosylmethionine-8-amino-7-oxononanoate aminotransferase
MIWRPYVQMKHMPPPYQIVDARGVYLYTPEREMIDSISSWWCMIHGYKNEEMIEAIREQASKLSHVMLAGLTHAPVERLSQKLESWLPGDLNYYFFSDSGSIAVEVALKMALQFYVNRGESERTKVLALQHAYHGDTFKTMEIGDDPEYHFILDATGVERCVEHIPATIPALEEAFDRLHEQLNCFIVEPLLQGAAGMKMYDVSFLKRARELCDEYDVLLIFDEVATGMGRTGNRFVSDLVLPDICTLGKALTGGYIGHAITAARRRVFEGFYGDRDDWALMHGPTFTANLLACAAASKSIEIFDREDYLSKIKRIEEIEKRELASLDDPRIKDVRIMGACACIEVKDAATLKGYREFAYERGVFGRPFSTCLYTMPPYIIEEEELVRVLATMREWFER